MKFFTRFLLASFAVAPPLVLAAENENIVSLQVCSVSDQGNFTQSFGELAMLFQENLPGVEAYALMDTEEEGMVAIVQGFQSAADHAAAMELAKGNEMMQVMDYFVDCSVEVWGGWDEAMKKSVEETVPGTQVFHAHEAQEGFIDFCRDSATSAHNFPNMFFFQGRRTTDVELNMATLKAMGEFYMESVPGVLAWVTAVNPNQPDVVHDLQLFRDIYAFVDHTNPLVYQALPTEIFPGLMGSWAMPLDYNGTYAGYRLTNELARAEFSKNGFPNVNTMDFWPRGNMMGQYMGFMNFCGDNEPGCAEEEMNEDVGEMMDNMTVMEDADVAMVERRSGPFMRG